MKKVFVVTRAASRETLLEELRALGVMHLEPVDPAAAAPEELSDKLTRIHQASQAIASVAPAGRKPEIDADAAADEILSIFHRSHENRNRLAALHREAGQLSIWGELRCEQLDALDKAGVPVKFYSIPEKQLGEVAAECVATLAQLPGKRSLVGVIQRGGEPTLPEEAAEIEPPQRDLLGVRAEAGEVDKTMADDSDRLAQLANLFDVLRCRSEELAGEVEYARALAGAMAGDNLFAVQGWAPAEKADTLPADLAEREILAAVDSRAPAEDETPPTLIQYHRWAEPIKGLFDILGTSPGYREFDVSGFFMIAMPIFAAMLIADGGYGLLLFLPPLLFYRKVAAKLGANLTKLVIIIGGVTVIWGVITANFFGVSGEQMSQSGGLWEPIGNMLLQLRLIRAGSSTASQQTMMNACFVIGAIHLSIAHLRRSLAFFPNLRFISGLGWVTFLWGMLGLVRYFVLDMPFGWSLAYPYLLITGGSLAILFARPNRNILKMLLGGLADFPLSALATFSDIISYIRLMAVGLASTVLAVSFNELALSAGFWPVTVIVLLCGHGLNIGLCIIALFAHGVRLNMLEFSSTLGIEWSGYPYEPFARKSFQEN